MWGGGGVGPLKHDSTSFEAAGYKGIRIIRNSNEITFLQVDGKGKLHLESLSSIAFAPKRYLALDPKGLKPVRDFT